MEITKEYIDELIKKAGLEEIVSVFNSAIEIDYHLTLTENLPLKNEEDGYRVLAKLIETALKEQK